MGLTNEDVRGALLEMKSQLLTLTKKVEAMIRCVEEEHKMGFGHEVSGLAIYLRHWALKK